MKRRIDKNRKPVELGSRVRVQHCTGRYGQTTTHVGKLVEITPSCSVWIELEKDYYQSCQKFGGRLYKAGDRFFICGVFHLDSQEKDTLIAYHEHHDYEHGHTSFLEQF